MAMASARDWDIETDVVVVGSGAAGLSAALSAAIGGARVLILEKAGVLGGTTAMSGGGTWIPANHRMLAAGHPDTPEEALDYIRAMMPASWAKDEDARWRSFVAQAPAMLEFVERHTRLRFSLIDLPDLDPRAPGGKAFGRLLSPELISRNALGPWRDRIRKSIRPQIFTFDEIILGPLMRRPVRTAIGMAPRLLHRLATRKVGVGAALVVGLLGGCLDHGCAIEANAAAEELISDETRADDAGSGRVLGLSATIGGERKRIRARLGVVLATGGYEWDRALLEKHFPTDWLLLGSPSTNTGDGHRMAAGVGAVFDHMDQATIYPVSTVEYEGRHHAIPVSLLDFPHCILVDRHGKRFVGESDRNAIALAMAARDPQSGASRHAPAWRIFDARFARQNAFAVRMANWVPGNVRKARSPTALARAIDVDPDALAATLARFNGFVRAGIDEDFGRHDPPTGAGPAPWSKTRGTIEAPPFYATPYYLGILGTKGGPRTNDRGQALRADGTIIAGLYCAGSLMANFFGTTGVAVGTTLGPHLTWGYLCGRNLLRENAP